MNAEEKENDFGAVASSDSPARRDDFKRDDFQRRDSRDDLDKRQAGAMEVVVSHNIEKAMKILKRKLIKEGLFKELKSRRYYEKPSERRKRKVKEARKKIRKDEARAKKGPNMY